MKVYFSEKRKSWFSSERTAQAARIIFEDRPDDPEGDAKLAASALLRACYSFTTVASDLLKSRPPENALVDDFKMQEEIGEYKDRAQLCFAIGMLIGSPIFKGEIGGPETHEIYENIMYGLGALAEHGYNLDESLSKVRHFN